LRYIALKYKPELYPITEPELCGTVDFSMDTFVGEVYKHHIAIVYAVFFSDYYAPPADQAAAAAAYMGAMAKWGKTFLKKGKYVLGDKLSIADFKVWSPHPPPPLPPHPYLTPTITPSPSPPPSL